MAKPLSKRDYLYNYWRDSVNGVEGMNHKVRILPSAVGDGFGQLNPISLREDGWRPGMDLEVLTGDIGSELVVALPKGTRGLYSKDYEVVSEVEA